VGNTAPNVLSLELGQEVVAQGSTRLEPNSDPLTMFYGYDDDGAMIGPSCTEATKTEPDKNTYLVFRCDKDDPNKNDPNCQKLKGADLSFDYGTHFLFQGHESGIPASGGESIPGGSSEKGYITRINLDAPSDADGDHRVTLLATHDVNGNP